MDTILPESIGNSRKMCIFAASNGSSLQPVTVQKDTDMAKERQEEPMDVAAMSSLIEAQRKQIDKLEKQLKYSRDKNLALNTLIDVIEEQGIKVRKKAGVKQ